MTSFWEILKSSKNLKASDAFAELWGKSIADSWDIITITGTLPLTFEAKGEALTDYRIYGTENGAGVQTENIFDYTAQDTSKGYVSGKILLSDGSEEINGGYYISEYIDISNLTSDKITIYIGTSLNRPSLCFYDANKDYISGANYGGHNPIVYDIPSNAKYCRFTVIKQTAYSSITMLVEGSTAPASYIPPGYQLPLTVTSGEQSDTYPVYIGDTQLMDEEYVDYEEQKIYKYAEPLKIYGWHVDPTISDPTQAVTYLADAVGKTPAAMGSSAFSYGDWADAFFMPKPCMLKYDGTVDYYLDPNDYTKKADGTASDVANSSYGGNAMMEWPLIWYKFEAGTADGEGYFYVSNKKVDSTYHCWCNYDANDNVIEHFYTAIYNGTGTDKLRSLSGVALTSANGNGGTTGQQEVDRATANNTSQAVEWYTEVLSDRLLISALMILMSKSLDDQTAFGRGIDSGDQSAKEAYVTGSLNDRGLFWGVTSAGSSGVKIFGMENWYGCCWHRTAGMVATSSGYRIKLTYGTVDGSTASGYSSAGTGYIAVSDRPTTSAYITKMQFNDKGFFPKVVGGSSSTYWAEYFYAGNGYALFGGSSHSGLFAGSSCVNLSGWFGYSGWSFSASLSCKPLAKTTPKLDLIPTNPPVPFPALSTYQGENTLSSEETVGEVSVTGKIKEI